MKKKTLQRTLGVVLSMTMVLGMLTGCGSTEPVVKESESTEVQESVAATENTEEKPYEYKTDITLTLSGSTGTTQDWAGTDLVAIIKDKFGINFECEPYPADVWSTKWNLMMAEDEIPDVITCVSPTKAQVSEWGAEGYLLKIDEYLEHMPNLVAFDEAHPGYLEACTSPDGHIYGLFKYSESVAGSVYRTFIKDEWLDNLGLEYPKSVDDLYDVLVAFKEQDANGNGDPNDEIPLSWSDKYSRKPLNDILAAYDIYTQKNTATPYFILEVDDNDKVYLSDTTENYKAFLTYMNKLWEEGLVDNTAYSITKEEVLALAKENKVGIFSNGTGLGLPDDPNPDVELEWFTGLTSEYNTVPTTGSSAQISNTANVILSANTEYPEEVCRLIDWFYTIEGATLTRNLSEELYEGKLWYDESVIEGYEEYPIKTIAADCKAPEGWESWQEYKIQKGYINEGFSLLSLVAEGSAEYAMINGTDKPEDLDAWCEANVSGYLANIHKRLGSVEVRFGYPTLDYSEEIVSERNSLMTDIQLYCQAAQAQFITGEVDIEAGWNDFINNLNKMGLPRLLEIEQEAYDAMYK